MDKIGHELIAEKKANATNDSNGDLRSGIQADQMAGKDLLSILGKHWHQGLCSSRYRNGLTEYNLK